MKLYTVAATACIVNSVLAGNLLGYASRDCIGSLACRMNAIPCCGTLAEVCDQTVRSWDAEDHNINLYKQDKSYFGTVHHILDCLDDPLGEVWYACAIC